ncbi:hypothetical protein AJ78_07605 [Emergomyces pasteurianus Ep9510]|uniref:Restriction of telomere capping protein 4 n=1 Tax=Emergomyces pasteurianus Ep9510 TaxID=1447872 RepID=A0A1J9Q921_9EURO|nr:hypothetical protein AJ78_07605 [Emergomyces pasteurianus Ep9510]
MCSDWNVYTLFNPSLRAVKTPRPSNSANLPLSRPVPANHQPQPQPHFLILSTCKSLQTVPAPSISPQTLVHPLSPRPPPSSRFSYVPSYPHFQDHHEVQPRAEDTHLNDFDEFLAGLDAADLNSSLCVPILGDADVERSSRCFPDGDEDRGLEKGDESLPDLSFSVECGLVGSTSIKTLRGDGSPTPGDDSLPSGPPIVADSDDDSTANGSIVDSIFTSLVKQDTSSRATSVSHSFKTGAGSDEASTGITDERSILLKRQHQPRVSISVMHSMVAVKVPVIAACLEEVISNLTWYENGPSSRLRTRQRRTCARSRREVLDTQDCKLSEKPVQCFKDDTIMSDTGDSCALFNSTDDNYHSHSTLFYNINHSLNTHVYLQFLIEAERCSCCISLLTQEEAVMLSSTLTQVVFKMRTEGQEFKQKKTSLDLREEHLSDGPEAGRFFLIEDQEVNMHASLLTNPFIDKQRQKKNYHVSVDEPLSISKPRTLLEISHRYPGGPPHPRDDPLVMPNAKPRAPSPSSTVTAMCSVYNSVIKVKAFSVFNAVNNRMRILNDSKYCSRYKSVVHKKVQKHGRKILSRSVLHSTGYYGLRDREILSAHVVSHFKDAINSLAGIDSVVSKYDLVVYAQEVLVLELLKMLVREDMRVDVKEACRILKESNEIGNLLNLE